MTWWKRTDEGPAAATTADERKSLPNGVWTKCENCDETILEEELCANLKVCPRCQHHHYLSANERVAWLFDEGTFVEIGKDIEPQDPIGFQDSQRYADRLKSSRKKTGLTDAAVAGYGRVDGQKLAACFIAFEFMGGSMASVVGERITRILEYALAERCPALISSASGGARMQEGILSLMQMAKTSAALKRFKDAGLFYMSLLHHPTTGGVAASFSMLGDVNIAEPLALIGFAGPRVIEQTIRQKLPPGFQRSEFLLEHGMVDMIVPRNELRTRISYLMRVFSANNKEQSLMA